MSQDNTPNSNSNSPYGSYGDTSANRDSASYNNAGYSNNSGSSVAAGSQDSAYTNQNHYAQNNTAYTNDGYNNNYAQAPAYNGNHNDQYVMHNRKPNGRGLAIASLVLGILGLLTFWVLGFGGLLGLIGLILGIVAIVKLKKSHGSKGLAIAGIITSILATLLGAGMLVLSIIAGGAGLDAYNACQDHLNDQAALEQCMNDHINNNMGK
ncbi:DUF4190 domain-containing protein [Rothia terrae]|uniref:DUF4190 domain-containing protein n=1 Tax=Rothia terrae TaxID=396015 RepID=A0A7H2BFS3_9MICC|nr:DUF4190 domain-containing protein [Rothia terrae]QNV38519.1 DUF4190 domain-containing protein [Rothia terrae]